MRLHVKIPNSNGVAANQTATWVLPIGRRYHDLRIAYSGVTLANITQIRVKANGEAIRTFSGADLDSMNTYDGRGAAAGILTIGFDRFGLYTQQGEEMSAIQTGSADPKTGVAITAFTLEMDLATGTPVIDVTATQSDNNADRPGPGAILRVMRYQRVFTAVGVNELSDLPKGTEGPRYQLINRVFFKTAATYLEIERDNRKVLQRSKATNDRIQLDGVRVPQSGWYVYDPTEEGYDWEGLTLVDASGKPFQDLRYLLTLPGGETTTIYVEYFGSLQG